MEVVVIQIQEVPCIVDISPGLKVHDRVSYELKVVMH
jgi:hypothetical protein